MSLSIDEILELESLIKKRDILRARNNLLDFTKYTFDKFSPSWFHNTYYNILNKFAEGDIKRLIISVPPQHGKSEGSSRRLPAYIFGKNPDKKIALASYNATFASKFNRQIQRILDSKEYKEVFPKTNLNSSNVVTVAGNYLRNSEEFEIVGYDGFFKSVGVGGGLTGNQADIILMDDLYKDYADATSPIISERVWEWYTTVVKTRLHNDSQELIVFTRWDENDLVGRLEKSGDVIEFDKNKSIDDNCKDIPYGKFLKVNFEALKEGSKTIIDSREENEPLWKERHSYEKLQSTRKLDPPKFSALYQGNPKNKEGLLYNPFGEYSALPSLRQIKSYTDVADEGKDYLCTIIYGLPLDFNDKHLYILDIVYTQKPSEKSEEMVKESIIRNNSIINRFESNNGGKGFARAVEKLLEDESGYKHEVSWFYQSQNKQGRIYSQSASVNRTILFPIGWQQLHPTFSSHILSFKKVLKENKFDDCADALTGVYEEEFVKGSSPNIIW